MGAGRRLGLAWWVALVSIAVLAACSGGAGTSSLTPSLPGGALAGRLSPGGGRVAVHLRMIIRGPHRRVRERGSKGPRFVSPSTDGVLIVAYPHGKPQTPKTLIAQNAIDVSSGSAACGGKTGFPRTCSVTIGVPATRGKNRDDFLFSSYDAPPAGRTFPSSAHLLGVGAVSNQRIVANKNNVLSIYLGGVIAGLTGQPAFVSLPADGQAQTVGFVIDPSDYGNNPIVAGSHDPYANPIVVSVAETGGSGHASLSLDGAAGAPSVTVRYSTDSVQLNYDGGGSPGYGDAVTLQSAAVNGSGGASESVQVSPLFVGSSLFSQAAQTLSLSPGLQTVVTLSELSAPSTQAYTAQLGSGCSSWNASLGSVSGSGASASVRAFGENVLKSTGCTMTVSDGTSSYTVKVANVASSTSQPSPAPSDVTISEFPLPVGSSGPDVITAGSDGALWFTENGSGKIGRIPTTATAGSSAQISEYPLPTSTAHPIGITSGPDGALWFAECDGGKIGRIPTNATPGSSAQITTFPVTESPPNPYGLAFATDGTIWYGNYNANSVQNMNTSGSVLSNLTTRGIYTNSFVTGPDGAMWFTECGSGIVGRVAVGSGGALTEALIPTGTATPAPFGIAAGSDGNVWMTDNTETGTRAIEKVTVTGTGIGAIGEIPVPTGGVPEYIAAGPDGALWFTDIGNNAIGRIPVNATSTADITEYPLPTASAGPSGIAVAPDGTIWFTECKGDKIGRLAIGTSPSVKRGVVERAIRHFPVYPGSRAHRAWIHPHRSVIRRLP